MGEGRRRVRREKEERERGGGELLNGHGNVKCQGVCVSAKRCSSRATAGLLDGEHNGNSAFLFSNVVGGQKNALWKCCGTPCAVVRSTDPNVWLGADGRMGLGCVRVHLCLPCQERLAVWKGR